MVKSRPKGHKVPLGPLLAILFTDPKTNQESLPKEHQGPLGSSLALFYWRKVNNLTRVGPRGTKPHWVHIYQFFALVAMKLSQESRPEGN